MIVFTAVKPFPFTKAEVMLFRRTGFVVCITTADGMKTITARGKEHAIEIANNATK